MMKTICVCGAGTMGSGIAQVAALAGFNTILFDVNKEMIERAGRSIEQSLRIMVQKNKTTQEEMNAALSLIQFTSSIKTCLADIVIEAIIEKEEAKVSLFIQLAGINNSNTIFASNTSSLPISKIAAAIPNPSRVAGMHFFNPAPLMKLVEVVKGDQTSEQVVSGICELAKQMGKTPVVCKDSPGFIVNRVARPYYLEAMRLAESSDIAIETIDRLMEATGFKMGPFKLMDMIGMDINFEVSNIVWKELGSPERLKPSLLQKQKVDANELGKKTGKGFYNYNG